MALTMTTTAAVAVTRESGRGNGKWEVFYVSYGTCHNNNSNKNK
jgi:hypothetical protein